MISPSGAAPSPSFRGFIRSRHLNTSMTVEEARKKYLGQFFERCQAVLPPSVVLFPRSHWRVLRGKFCSPTNLCGEFTSLDSAQKEAYQDRLAKLKTLLDEIDNKRETENIIKESYKKNRENLYRISEEKQRDWDKLTASLSEKFPEELKRIYSEEELKWRKPLSDGVTGKNNTEEWSAFVRSEIASFIKTWKEKEEKAVKELEEINEERKRQELTREEKGVLFACRAVISLVKKEENGGINIVEMVLISLACSYENLSCKLDLMQGHLDLSAFPIDPRGLLAIPVRLAEGHVVAFFVNQNTRTLEYYDPKGLTLLDRKDALLYSESSAEFGSKKSLLEIFYELRNKYACQHVIENLNKHQSNIYSNAVLISSFFKRRVEGTEFESISATACDNKDVRFDLVNLLFQYLENYDSRILATESSISSRSVSGE